MLLGLTLVSGVVDAVSILAFGRVFVANMTGNVVFVGLGIVGAPGFSLAASIIALAGFLFGALVGGLTMERLGKTRALLLRNVAVIEVVLFVIAFGISLRAAAPFSGETRDVIVAITAPALGLQNSVVRRIAVPDLTTTVLTMTLTGIAADIRAGGQVVLARRILAVATMLIGAIAGALLVIHSGAPAGLALTVALLVAVSASTALGARHQGAWKS